MFAKEFLSYYTYNGTFWVKERFLCIYLFIYLFIYILDTTHLQRYYNKTN